MEEKIPKILKEKIKKDLSLKEISFVKIGGRVRYFLEVSQKKELITAIRWAKKNNLKIIFIGNASNILFSDNYFQGIVIRVKNKRFVVKKNYLLVSAGLLINDFLKKCLKYCIKDYEWLSGIPGTMGGAVFGNAGAYSRSIGEKVIKVKTIDIDSLKEKIYSQKDCQFDYRESIFKQKEEVIWEVFLKKEIGKKEEIKNKIDFYLKERVRKNNFLYPSLGCIFKNLPLSKIKNLEEIKKYNPPIKGGKISAGWLIEKANLKKKKVGGAMIAPFHHNIIVNYQDATFKDFLTLIQMIKKKVFQKFKILLEEEIIIKNF
ncbi:MAG: UDP-N-acetylmuramate dehydrogenase [Candidatus Paceibacterota bacterium]